MNIQIYTRQIIQNTKIREINQDGPLSPRACFQRGPLKRALKTVKTVIHLITRYNLRGDNCML